jgi:hypothetical protein
MASTTSYAFLHNVLSRSGASTEALTVRGTECHAEFVELLLQALVSHRTTSLYYPQADGLAERIVGTFQRGLHMYCESSNPVDWDSHTAWIALGYRCLVQQSTNLSPQEVISVAASVFPSGATIAIVVRK